MITTCVYIKIKKEYRDEFIKATIKNHENSIKEEGNLRFDFASLQNSEDDFLLYEAYVSEEAASVHKETAHYKEWRQTVEKMMAEPRKGVRYDLIVPKA